MEPNPIPQKTPSELADDMLEGADAIAEFLFGSNDDIRRRKRNLRKVYYLSACTRLPIFRLGSLLCARKSVLLGFISVQESRVLIPEG
jgi:hypothetical protein